jgi:lysophospholipase L1-like esterase
MSHKLARTPVATAAALMLLMSATITPARGASRAPIASAPPASIPASSRPIAPGEEVVIGRGDTAGWHLFAASAGERAQWRPLATVLPEGGDGERWIGQQCLTGDGRYVVAVTASWHAQNNAAEQDHGALAYVVDAHTGAVRPLLGAVTLDYFDPGCGTGSTVALTRFLGTGQRATEVIALDAATGAMRLDQTVPGEMTSAVPVGTGVVAAAGATLVALDGRTARQLATLPGGAFDLRANNAGGVDLLIQERSGQAGVWRVNAQGASRVAGAPLGAVSLAAGRGGRTTVLGLSPPRTALLRSVTASADTAVSLGGWLPPLPADRLPAPAKATSVAAPSPSAVGANTTKPACSVPRNSLTRQVLQPNDSQIDWAAQQAVRGWLTQTRSGAPYGVPNYQPSTDFPRHALTGFPNTDVPPQVMYGIFAQESNWQQASFHAIPGVPGNPLIANYYGDNLNANSIDYSKADCGYGLGQLTSIMAMPRSGQATAVQVRVAVDFAENAAAAAQAVEDKWNQLSAAGITVNNADPTWLENWYFAVWAYNSGVNPQPSTGGNTGCTPSPSCTDAQGYWGLGWSNNPINGAYNPNRLPFLRYSYNDASHPQDWPYQEKVLGWMETPLINLQRQPSYPSGGRLVVPPSYNFLCDPVDDNCSRTYQPNPHDPTTWYCQSSNFHCWWHTTASWVDCTTGACHPYHFTITSPSAPQPPTSNPHPPVCTLPAGTPSGTVVVDEEATGPGAPDLNLVGCPKTPNNWRNGGTFTTTGVTDSKGHDLVGAIDWHQLGAGFGGHMWFTHTRPKRDILRTVTGTWTPNLTGSGWYEVRSFVPDTGASTTEGVFTVSPNDGTGQSVRYVDQSQIADDWISLGFWHLNPGASVTLSNVTDDGNGTVDIAFNAVEFMPVEAGSYVSLGDSYSAGEGVWPLPPYDDGTDVQNPTSTNGDVCHRSSDAYARQYALLTTTFANHDVVHLACSGSNMWDVGGSAGTTPNPDAAGSVFYNEPVQTTEIPSDAKLVTLTVGGNDAGFIDVLTNCVVAIITTCQQEYKNPDGTDKELQLIDSLGTGLVSTYDAVKQAAPNAQIYVLTYPNIFVADDSQPADSRDCTAIQRSDRDWLIGLTSELDAVIRTSASTAGVHIIDEHGSFAGHEECTSNNWVNPPELPLTQDLEDISFHPNVFGYQKVAADLKSAIPIP